MVKTIEWNAHGVRLIDQTILPQQKIFVECKTYKDMAEAISRMQIRGAPAIGIAGAFGVALGARQIQAGDFDDFYRQLDVVCRELNATRPTAVNLSWATDKMRKIALDNKHLPLQQLKDLLEAKAKEVLAEDIAANRRMGAYGCQFIKDGDTILTHCNAGALATGGYGTALGVIRVAHEEGKKIQVYADETRPFMQGTRLTAWELMEDGIPVTLNTDSMAGYLMSLGKINLVIVGADRIAGNGDTANKIGTYSVAILAKEHGIPFYVAAPLSTIDFKIRSGQQIEIEARSEKEVTHVGNTLLAPAGVKVFNPAFDVTPNKYITAIITDKGVAKPPYVENLAKLRD
ncbi:MAG: S-methyl-5-thioribose-1-phosphate isomerase [Candidatus Schekmanbacteria bacterium]|nr:S-methyl-5-thioribose-1-phosphate isomerase [Candidatus Schekmanbacteria bacterium]